ILLLDSDTLEPIAVADAIVDAVDHPSVKTEMPACQIELATEPHGTPRDTLIALATVRSRLVEACTTHPFALARDAEGNGPSRARSASSAATIVPVAAAVHPSVATSPLGDSLPYQRIEAEFGAIAHRQLVGALQVHVAI